MVCSCRRFSATLLPVRLYSASVPVASLGVACVVLLSGSIGGVALSKLGVIGEVTITLSAIVGSLLIMALIAFVAQKVRGNVTLLIMGVMIGYIANAIIGVLKFFSAEEDIRAYVIWGLGSFSRVSGGQTSVFIILMLVLLPMSFFLIKTLNLLLLGDSYAKNLGLNIKRARLWVIGCSGVLVAVVTAYCAFLLSFWVLLFRISVEVFSIHPIMR